MRFILFFISVFLISFLESCSTIKQTAHSEVSFQLSRLFPTSQHPAITFADSIIASPLIVTVQGKAHVIVPVSNGTIALLDNNTGDLLWQINAPAPKGQSTQLIATPVLVGDKLIISYQCIDKGVRVSHRLAVIDLKTQRIDARFPILTFAAEKTTVDGRVVRFNAPTAFSHAALKHIATAGTLGTVYAAFGNSGDVQPFHGWLFAVDLEAWRDHGTSAAISRVLLTTAEADCPVTMAYGTQEMICGGGIWSPSGVALYPIDNDVELFIPTGNGQLDLARHDYANTVMRVTSDLAFDAGCDTRLCTDFNPSRPNAACLNSCKNLFIPRLAEDNAPFRPANGECDNKTFADCLAWMDYDLGGSTPVKLTLSNGQSVLVQSGKDGGAYLLDAEHLGRQYDREQVVPLCGTKTDPCTLGWGGMIVTQVIATAIDNTPVVVITTFSADKTHAAGLVALKVVLQQGKPQFERFWQFPKADSADAIRSFRSHPSLPTLTLLNGEPIVWVVDIGKQGTVYAVRVRDGLLMAKQVLQGTGRQLAAPLFYQNRIYVASIVSDTGKAMLEAYRLEQLD